MVTKQEAPGPAYLGVRNLDVRIASAAPWTPEVVSGALLLCGLAVGLLFLHVNERALEQRQFWIVRLVAILACMVGAWFLLAFCNHLRGGGGGTWVGRVIGVAMLCLAACYGAGLGFVSLHRAARSDGKLKVGVWTVTYRGEVTEGQARQLCKDLSQPGVLPQGVDVILGSRPDELDSFSWFLLSSGKYIRLERDGETYAVTFWLPETENRVLLPQTPPTLASCASQLSAMTFAGRPVRICLRRHGEAPILVVESTDR